jgi:hypothetical protein
MPPALSAFAITRFGGLKPAEAHEVSEGWVPGIRVFGFSQGKAWMAGLRPP